MNITLDHVSVRFQDRLILTDVSLTLNEHRVGLIGDNGSGKSTFARLLNGLLLPDEGRVTLDGLDTKTSGPEIRSRVGFLFQNPDNQIVMPTVAEDLALGLKPLKLDPEDVQSRVSDSLDRFGLTHLKDRSAHLLSGGEKQLLALAGVMVSQPDLLICDEPTTLLDQRTARIVTDTIAALPCAVFTVTHHVEQLTDYDRVLVINGGRITHDDSAEGAIAYYQETLRE